jgi:hypothetical protein
MQRGADGMIRSLFAAAWYTKIKTDFLKTRFKVAH